MQFVLLLFLFHFHLIIYYQQIAALGQLELNANNNDEVRREAALNRQKKFLRALAKQYLL